MCMSCIEAWWPTLEVGSCRAVGTFDSVPFRAEITFGEISFRLTNSSIAGSVSVWRIVAFRGAKGRLFRGAKEGNLRRY